VRDWSAEEIAAAAGAELVRPPRAAEGPRGAAEGPLRAVVDSREVGPGELFVGIAGARADGGAFAIDALAAGAWGVLVTPSRAAELLAGTLLAKSGGPADVAFSTAGGAVLAAADPTAALGRLARAYRRQLGAAVIAVTGSTGKTSTKDILAVLLSPVRATHANRANLNTEIGLPLALLEAPAGTEVIVLELAMRGAGQIAELAAICEPDVGVIVNVGPVHVELLGSLDAIAATKSELLEALPDGARAVIPVSEPLLESRVADGRLDVVRCGDGGDARLLAVEPSGRVVIELRGKQVEVTPSLRSAHQLANLVMAVAAADAVGVTPHGEVSVVLSALRGERVELPGSIEIVNDCYNANPMSTRAALDDLAASARGRRVAVLGEMLELGPEAERYHAEAGAHAAASGVALLLAVGPLAEAMVEPYRTGAPAGAARAVPDADAAARLLGELLAPGDTVLVKGSRGVGLERVAQALTADAERGS
jgi:UDP-N-acetylmuramoyl-tripeptide--D-alanyl-D-alanine ligase